MPIFEYKLVDKENKLVMGSVSALSKKSARKKLLEDGIVILHIMRKKNKSLNMEISLPFGVFGKSDQITFFRNFSAMLGVGMSMIQTLEILEEQARSQRVKKTIREMSDEISNGEKLSDAMKKKKKYFSEYLCETVAIGESVGDLASTMNRISADLEQDQELSKKITAAMAYPFVVISVMLVVLVLIATLIIPQIAKVFEDMNAPLPLSTRLILSSIAFFKMNVLIIIGVVFVMAFAFFQFYRNKKGHYALHYLFLKTPVFGELIKEFNIARFFRSLESLYVAGLPLVKSVDIAKKVLKNDIFRSALESISPLLLHGTPLSEALRPFPHLFPSQTRKIIEVGEKTGKLDEMFSHTKIYYERAIRHKTQIMSTLIEPFLIVFIGAVVGGLALSVFVPIYNMSSIM